MSAEAPRATTVFFSYSRGDRKRALPVIQLLEAAGYSVWWDGMLEGGEHFAKTTAHALDTARAVVVLWSKTSIGSHWVHDEATSGRDRKTLVPLSMDGVEPPLGFRQFQVIDISHHRIRRGDQACDALLRAVAALHAGEAAATVSAAPASPPVDRRLLLIGGVVAMAGAAGAAWLWRSGQGGQAPAATASVAVLPFANLSGDPEQAYFSEGLAAEVRAELARNPGLLVAAQASSNRFRTRAEDARTMASQLGVAFLLDGNVRRAGDTVRVSAELIDGRSGFSQWSEQFERPIADVFAVQDEISAAVVSAITSKMGGESTANGGSTPLGSAARPVGGTSSVPAYDAYLRGQDLFGQGLNEATDRAALAQFDAALKIDPSYGTALAARARVLVVIGNQYANTTERPQLFEAAIVSANRAIREAPQLAAGHLALGFVLFNGRIDAKAAGAPYDRAAELGQGDADVLSRFALFCARTGRFDAARTAIARATTLDPLNAGSYRIVGEIEYAARNFAGAIGPLERALSLNPRMGVTNSSIGFARLMMGDPAGAEKAFAAEPSAVFRLTGLAIVRHRLGKRPQAQAAFNTLVAQKGDASLYQQAQILAQWSDTARALAALKRARATGDAGLVYMRNDPMVDPLRKLPEFSDLLIGLGFS
ncbi:TIR domain-containing protein [Sandarakinorhabdus sp.]|uniref:TIR domain-containing protein n=1 Tax=Sandarakinorhabdus sp. TaxID=1916663 RepID=UPI0033428345